MSGKKSTEAWDRTLKAAEQLKPVADQAIMDAALAMAWTAIDLASDQTLRNELISSKRD